MRAKLIALTNKHLHVIDVDVFFAKIHGKTNNRLHLCRHKMVKSHNCLVIISNGPNSSEMTYVTAWYDSGRVGDGFSWPQTIQPGRS